MFDGIVIGGGAAGMFAAIHAAEAGNKVLLLERNDRLGKKLLITGKGRCNLANRCSADEVLQNIPRNPRFLYSAVKAFSPDAVLEFFTKRGCNLKTERGNRVFPISDKSQDVLTVLQNSMRCAGVVVRNERARDIVVKDGTVTGVRTDSEYILCKWVILATGGLSYPTTGSTGDGFAFAQSLGHTIVPCTGSLVPLESDEDDCAAMQGLSLRNVAVKLLNDKGKVIYKDFGELLFTHFGVSGPTVLSASAHLQGTGCLCIDLKPALTEEKLNERILRDLEQYRNRTMENALCDLLPRTMIPVVLRRIGVEPSLQANSLRKTDRRALISVLKNFAVTISGKRPVAEAIITSGGVKTSEIDPGTMQSKKVHGLYFAGEIIDCDAYTGGFNLQIAWSTAYLAAISAAKTVIDKTVSM